MIRSRDDEMEVEVKVKVEMEIEFALWQPQDFEEDMTQENMVVFALEMWWWSGGVVEWWSSGVVE
jgi:hypothetical protein